MRILPRSSCVFLLFEIIRILCSCVAGEVDVPGEMSQVERLVDVSYCGADHKGLTRPICCHDPGDVDSCRVRLTPEIIPYWSK